MTIETFLMLLLAVSVFTGLFTEAVKIVMDGLGEKYCSNVLAGGVACVLGMVLPPMAVLALLTYCYTAVRDNLWVMAAMTGVRASIVPIMAAAALNLVKGAFRFPPCAAVAALAFVLYLFFDVSCVWLVLMGVVSGIALCEFYERRGGNGHGAA